jgi:uncharacterized protein YdeI (BOF family)
MELAMKILALASVLALAAAPALAHSGGLDSNGCHQNAKEKVYQCHEGPLKGQTFKSKEDAEKKMKTSQAKPSQQQSAVPPERKK